MVTDEIIKIGKLSRLKPTVNFANKMSAEPGQVWGPRTIPDCQLIYIISGNGTLILGGNVFQLNPGECVFYGMNSPHRLVSSKIDPFTFTSIHFSWDEESPDPIHPLTGIKNCSTSELGNVVPFYQILVDEHGEMNLPSHFILPNGETLFAQIVREYQLEEPGYSFVLRGLLTQLITTIIRKELNGEYSSGERRKIAPALEAIRKKPNINWSSGELADLCGYHPTYFASIFRETIGYSPKHYLIQERIRKAKQLLLEEKTIEEVSIKLGYTSLHYFSRNFKTVTGLTPTQYKIQSFEL